MSTTTQTPEPDVAVEPETRPGDFPTPLGWTPPDRETFSFESYVQGHSTFPTFEHTVYLDQAQGLALLNPIEKNEEISAMRRALKLWRKRRSRCTPWRTRAVPRNTHSKTHSHAAIARRCVRSRLGRCAGICAWRRRSNRW